MSKQTTDMVVYHELKRRLPALEEQLVGQLNIEAQIGAVVQVVRANKYLAMCEPQSIIDSVCVATRVGLSLHPSMAQADIVPRGKVARFEPRYGGLITLAHRTGLIKAISADVVFWNDEFDHDIGNQTLHHKKNLKGDRGDPYAAWARVWFSNGGDQFVIMRRDQIEEIRDDSDGYKAFVAGKIKSTPWNNHPGEMWKKTAIKRLMKTTPKSESSTPMLEAIAHDNASEAGSPAPVYRETLVVEPRQAETVVVQETGDERETSDGGYLD
jgi:recombination protein RecT